eukprot:1183725-Amphidinium_carterae.1
MGREESKRVEHQCQLPPCSPTEGTSASWTNMVGSWLEPNLEVYYILVRATNAGANAAESMNGGDLSDGPTDETGVGRSANPPSPEDRPG